MAPKRVSRNGRLKAHRRRILRDSRVTLIGISADSASAAFLPSWALTSFDTRRPSAAAPGRAFRLRVRDGGRGAPVALRDLPPPSAPVASRFSRSDFCAPKPASVLHWSLRRPIVAFRRRSARACPVQLLVVVAAAVPPLVTAAVSPIAPPIPPATSFSTIVAVRLVTTDPCSSRRAARLQPFRSGSSVGLSAVDLQ